MRARVVWAFTCAIVLALAAPPVEAATDAGWDDPRLEQWARDFSAGKASAVFAAVEKDLRSSTPHLRAPLIWTMVADYLGVLDRELAALDRDDTLRKALGPVPRLFALRNEGPRALEFVKHEDVERAGPDARRLWGSVLSIVDERADRRALAADSLAAWPSDFAVAWEYYLAGTAASLPRWRDLQDELARDTSLTGDGVLWLRSIARGSKAWVEMLHGLDAFTASRPTDVWALRTIGDANRDLKRFADAEAAYAKALALFPFDRDLVVARSAARARQGKFDDAYADVEQWVRGLTGDARKLELARSWSAALLAAGERGRTRRVLDDAVKRWPKNAELRRVFARMDRADNRPRSAEEHARACLAAGPNLDCADELVGALLNDGRVAIALDELARLDAAYPTGQAWLIPDRQTALDRSDRAADARRLLETATKAYPEYAWPRFEVARYAFAVGDVDVGLVWLKEAVAIDPGSWSTSRALDALQTARDAKTVDKLLVEWTKAYPWSEALWQARANRLSGDDADARKVALWREARKVAADETFAYVNELQLHVDAEQWSDASQVVAEMRRVFEALGEGPAGDALLQAFWLAEQKAVKGSLDEDDAEKTLTLLDASRSLISESNYWRYREPLLRRLGRGDDASAVASARAAVDIDDTSVVFALFRQSAKDQRRWSILARHLDRDPYEPVRIADALTLHGGWGGSPIVGLRLLREARDRGLTVKEQDWEWSSYGKLGAYVYAYQREYLQKTSIANSTRYRQWFEAERLRAQQPAALVALPFEPSTAGNCPLSRARDLVTPGSTTYAVICHADGTIVVREDDARTGQPVLIAEGAAWIRAKYDADSDRLIGLETSSGERISIDYDANGEIQEIRGREFTFQVVGDAKANAQRVILVGKGQIEVSTARVTRPDGGVPTDDEEREFIRLFQKHWGSVFEAIEAMSSRRDQVPWLPLTDPALEKLQAKAQDGGNREWLALAEHLVAHVDDRGSHASDAYWMLTSILEQTSARDPALSVRAIALLDKLFRRTRAAGLSADEFSRWNRWVDWLAAHVRTQPRDRAAKKLAAAIAKAPHGLVPQGRWLPTSQLENPGHWHRDGLAAVLPGPIRDRALSAAVIRANGDVVLGSAGGLSVLRGGFWEWYGWDGARGRWSPDGVPGATGAGGEVLALAEDPSGALWIGTAQGVVVVAADYTDESARWTETEGLPTARVEALAPMAAGVFVGTSRGAVVLTRGTARAVPVLGLEHEPIATIGRSGRGADDPLLVATPSALYSVVTGNATRVVEGAFRAVVKRPDTDEVVVARGRDVMRFAWNGVNAGPLTPLPGRADIVGDAISGLESVEIEPGITAIAIQTDRGISFYREAHVEHLLLPLADRHPGVDLIASRDGASVLVTTAGIYRYEQQRAMTIDGKVHDLLAAPDLGLTFVAHERGLGVVRQDHPEHGLLPLDWFFPKHLARGPDGGIYLDNVQSIFRFDPVTAEPAFVFEAQPSNNDCLGGTEVRSVVPARDGTLWVAAGPSVFRFRDGAVEEFSIYVTPDRFPARSHCIDGVYETVQGEIWVVAADESHLTSDTGIKLVGGLLRWTGSGFERVDDAKDDAGWFITGYTDVGDGVAVLGTTDGFARHTSGRPQTYEARKEPSYARLRAERPMLFEGTRGAMVGDGVWLFGSAAGLVAYRDGGWFYPERLNWLLPGPGLADRGARAVQAVSVDGEGRIYVANDHGLLVYDAGGGGAAALLVEEGQTASAFADAAQRQLANESSVLVDHAPSGSELQEMRDELAQSQEQVEALEARVAALDGATIVRVSVDERAGTGQGGNTGAGAGGEVAVDATALREELARKQRSHASLLTRLESKHRAAFQLLGLNPLELAAVARDLGDDVTVVQYLPTRRKLYIQIVTRRSVELREVKVGSEELDRRARRVSRRLSAATQARGFTLRKAAERGQPPLEDELRWLYERLLRPVESLLSAEQRIYIVPSGGLTYLPFGALLRRGGGDPEYAVERFTFGYVSSMYILDLMLRDVPGDSDRVVVVADPDGSLPGARAEGQVVALQFDDHVLLREDATRDRVVEAATQAGILHLATHGKLDHSRPERSFLLLAGTERLTIPEVMTLDLGHADLVVLSACDTGVGASGLEYATLARSFMHAGASTVIATLWAVQDDASRELMARFYDGYRKGVSAGDALQAMTTAQRAMIASGGDFARPESWAGFVPYGGRLR